MLSEKRRTDAGKANFFGGEERHDVIREFDLDK
jgi:hypothetical protein